MNGVFKFENGDEVKDTITGFAGVVVARTEWLNGCIRYVVQSRKLGKDDKPVDMSVDEPQLVYLHPPKPKKEPKKRPGGPHDSPQRHAEPRRF